jgi:hypothetical protein
MPLSITPGPFEWFPEGAWIVALHRFIEISAGIIVALIVVAVWPERSAIAAKNAAVYFLQSETGAMDLLVNALKCGSLRSGSNIGSSFSSAGVSGRCVANGPSYGIVSNFFKAAMERS